MEKLERQRELPNIIASSLSAMLAVGLFALPGFAGALSGPTLAFAYIVAGAAAIPMALAIAELATAMPRGSGIVVYLEGAFGPFGATIAGLALWGAQIFAAAFAASCAASYLGSILEIPIDLSAAAALGLTAGVSALGFRGTGKIRRATIVLGVLALVTLAGLGIFEFDTANFASPLSGGASDFVTAAALVFLAFGGITVIASVAREVRRPNRNLPIALLITIALGSFIYGLIATVLTGEIPVSELVGPQPIVVFAGAVTDIFEVRVSSAIVAAVALFAFVEGRFVESARLLFAMSRGDLLPEPIGRLHRRTRMPLVAIAFSGAAAALAVLSLETIQLAIVASTLLLLLSVTVCLATVVLRESRAQWYRPGFAAALYPAVPAVGVISGLIFLFALGPSVLVTAISTGAAGLAAYLLAGRKRASRKGVIGQRSRRPDLVRSGQFPAPSEREGASVVVALFGGERSPETLTELAEALAEGGRLEVVYLTELPEQTSLEALSFDEPRKKSVKRRVLAMAAAREIDLDFEAITSRDVVATINTLTSERECKWLVTEWTRRGHGRVTFNNPLGWLRDHLGSNLATFYDGGVRYFREIMVHVEPGPHDALVLGTADHLAAVHGANLTFVRYLPTSVDAAQVQAAGDYLDQVRELCSASSETLILRGSREDRALIEASGSTDLMITAGVARRSFFSGIRGSVWDRVTEEAACSVLRLRTPPVQLHTSFERYQGKVDEGARSFVDYIDERCVRAGIAPGKKDALFQTFAASFSQLSGELKPAAIVAGLWERERSQNTALGEGIALPHATLPEAKRTHLGVFTSSSPVEFDAPDGVGVDVFFVTLGPPGDRQEHLRLLGAIARLCRKTDLLVRLRAAWSGTEMLEAITECAAEQGI